MELSDPASVIISLNIVLRIQHPFANDISSAACLLLSKARKIAKGCESLYCSAVASGLSHAPRSGLSQSCTAVAVSTAVSARATKASDRFFRKLETADDVARCTVWWALYERIDTMSPTTSYPSIKHLLTEAITNRWSQELDNVPEGRASVIRTLLESLEIVPIEAPRKRKRKEERDVFTTLRQRIPGLTLEGEGIDSLAEALRK